MHGQWGTRAGFTLASIGAAVGLGNIWRFAYVAGENGGGAFLVVYIVLVAAIGIPLVVAELAVGKRGAADAATAFEMLAPHSIWRHAGWLGVAAAALILSYYSVIAGWALRYFVASLTGALWAGASEGFGGYFSRFIANASEPIYWQLAMMLASMLVVAGGIGRGIERVNLVLMPVLAAIVIALAAHALTLPGGGRGLSFLFAPEWGAVADPQVILAALGQAFFSIGVGMAVFVTYGSYMRHDFGVAASAVIIVLGDTMFAIMAGLAVFPAVFAFGGNPAAGPELAFITLPQVFLAMPGGRLAGPVFFFLLSAAALTSMISLLEVPVAAAVHRLKVKRWSAVAALGPAIALAGVPSGLSYGLLRNTSVFGQPILDAVDHTVSNFLLPLSALALAILAGYVVPGKTRDELETLADRVPGKACIWVWRVVPMFIIGLIVFRFFP
jgi:NSS family neurotransmitter:Na+ symporter